MTDIVEHGKLVGKRVTLLAINKEKDDDIIQFQDLVITESSGTLTLDRTDGVHLELRKDWIARLIPLAGEPNASDLVANFGEVDYLLPLNIESLPEGDEDVVDTGLRWPNG